MSLLDDAKRRYLGCKYAIQGWIDLRWQRRSLKRFHKAQANGVYERAYNELLLGEKRTHWMWFIFPQGKGLGSSYNSRLYALTPREARQYWWKDRTLNTRLRECMMAVQASDRSLEQIFGEVDAMKFRSCMDLFYEATGSNLFLRAKDQAY